MEFFFLLQYKALESSPIGKLHFISQGLICCAASDNTRLPKRSGSAAKETGHPCLLCVSGLLNALLSIIKTRARTDQFSFSVIPLILQGTLMLYKAPFISLLH